MSKEQQPSAGEFTEKFNRIMEEAKSMFVVSQAMAKNSFDATLKQLESEAGDFTKRIRTQPYNPKWENTLIIRTEDRDELCDRLDRAESINKDLLAACEKARNLVPQCFARKLIEEMDAAIAKAKKE